MGFVANMTWVLVVLSILGNVFVIYDKKTTGYVVWLIANTGWIAYNIYIAEYSQMSLFVVYSFLSTLGIFVEYRKSEKKDESGSKCSAVPHHTDENQGVQMQEV